MKKIASMFLIVIAAFVAGPAVAQTWTGAGADNNWSTGANWSGGVAPASSPATQLLFGGSLRNATIADASWTVNRMTFGSGAFPQPWFVSGQPITLSGVGAAILTDTQSVIISNALVLAAPTTASAGFRLTQLAGPISGPGSLTVTGSSGGVVQLLAANTYTGGTTVASGTLQLDGSNPGPVTVSTGQADLRGIGTVTGAVTLLGPFARLTPRFSFATGNLTAAAGSVLSFPILGPARGVQYGTLNVTGTVTISNATLELPGLYTPQPGDVFTIIDNDGADPVVGTFNGLPEGATVTFNGVPLRISYVGGTGNDVTLTSLAVAAPAAGVPTLSEWGLIVLACMVLGIGLLKSRRGA